jgi:CheY-like chemotaxis protein
MEAELFQAHKMEAIGALAGGIAHDFNNILAALLGYAEMAKDDIPQESHAGNCINQVLKAGNRAKELVRQILTFSRKGPEMRQQPLQPSFIIKEGLKLMRASLPTTIEIRENIHSDCGLISANPTNIHQILVNLCTNALHAMEDEKGVLTVTLTRVEQQEAEAFIKKGVPVGAFIELMVGDTGCGMNEATVKRVFEPYFTTKGIGKGSGMGLALVHGIVKGLRGFIRVESEPGKGTAFHVYFPAIDEKTAVPEEEKQEPLTRGTEKILVIDDEESIVAMYKGILELQGYRVEGHSDSEKALEAFRMAPDSFDLILSDQTMPHLSGSELAKEILQIRPNIPIILCTGYSSLVSKEKAQEIGIERFIMKPVERKTLMETVREVLDNCQEQTA